MSENVVVVTLANAARLGHVVRQAEYLGMETPHVVVALGDAPWLKEALPDSHVVDGRRVEGAVGDRAVNLAHARNLGGDLACDLGADVIVFLDADCLPGQDLIPRYCAAARSYPEAVLAGPVTYLPAGVVRVDNPRPHPARPNPPAGVVEPATRYEFFWSLSFAVTAPTWRLLRRTFGGFDTRYEGYGGEDTDFGQHLLRAGIDLMWVGGAHAFHQWHPVSNPPVEHLADIVANATRFYEVWGWWPMQGWLEKFEEAGLVAFRDGRWVIEGQGSLAACPPHRGDPGAARRGG